MYTFTPKRSNNNANILIGALFFCAAVIYLLPALFPKMPYSGIFQSAGLVCIIAALAVMSRYCFKLFTYEIRQNGEGELDLDVVETQGKRRYTVCRVGLKNIERLEIMTGEKKKALKKGFSGRKKFYYLPDILPTRSIVLFVTECGEPLVLVLAYDEALVNILAPNNK